MRSDRLEAEGRLDVLAYIDGLEAPVRDAVAPWAGRIPAGTLSRCRLVRLGKGEELVRMLDRCESVYVLCRGAVRSTSHALSGAAFTIDEFEAPTVFGEMEAIADSALYHSTLVALSDCEFVEARRDDYLGWLKSDPEALLARSRRVVQSLLRQSGTERSLLGWAGTERIMFVLCQYCRQLPADGEGGWTIAATRSELAERANVSTKTVSRALAALEGRGMLARRGRKIAIDRRSYERLDAAMRRELETSLHEGREKEEPWA